MTLAPSATQQFAAKVTGGSGNVAVQWSVDGKQGGTAASGKITASGLYTAPPVPGQHKVSASSSADPSKRSAAQVVVSADADAIAVSVRPTLVSVTPQQQVTFSATVTGTANPAVQWSVDGIAGGNSSVGTITATGLYTGGTSAGRHSVTAASVVDLAKSAAATAMITSYAGTFTYQNDNGRTGQNVNEVLLTPLNVKRESFGKIFSHELDGWSLAQPLYAASVNVPGTGFRNLVYVVTEHDSVYAFDADDGSSSQIWHVNFTDPARGVTTIPGADTGINYYPEFGITATPVIDPAAGTIYVLAATRESGHPVYRLHALDFATGKERNGSPVTIEGKVQGTGTGSKDGQVAFDPAVQLSRPGLLLANGNVYVAFGSYSDVGAYHGWIFAYDATSLAQTAVFTTTPNGARGAIWGSGCGLAVDAQGSVYAAVANGTFSESAGNFGQSLVRLEPGNSGLKVADYYTTSDPQGKDANDLDLGSGGPLLLPDLPGSHPHVAAVASKDGTLYVLDRDSLGHFHPSDDKQALELLHVGPSWTSPAYWNNFVFMGSSSAPLRAYRVSEGSISSSPSSRTQQTFGYPGVIPVISANGTADGIVWALERVDQNNGIVLHAYDATDLGHELYNSSQDGSRDGLGTGTRFAVPLVANGKVYVATTNRLIVFGLFP